MRRIRIADWRFRIASATILIVALALSRDTVSLAGDAQSRDVPRIGILSSFAPPDPQVDALKQGVRDLGWVEGQNVVVDYRYADGHFDRIADLVAELVRLKVDVLVVGGEAGIRAARDATRAIPIVMANSGDPVGTGLIASLSRPGGKQKVGIAMGGMGSKRANRLSTKSHPRRNRLKSRRSWRSTSWA